MKKGKLFLGMAASVLGVFALASCGSGMTTNTKKVEQATQDVLKAQISDDEYKAQYQGSMERVIFDDDYYYSYINPWVRKKVDSESNSSLYSIITNRDFYTLPEDNVNVSSVDSYFINVMNMVNDGAEYEFIIFDYTGRQVLKYRGESSSEVYPDDKISYSYYDDDDYRHTGYKYVFETELSGKQVFYSDYCAETKTFNVSTNNPDPFEFEEPLFNEIRDGEYIKYEELTNAVVLTYKKNNTTYTPIELPKTTTATYIFKDKLYYQTVKLLADESSNYSYYVIDEDNGETLKYELKTYCYDFNTAELDELKVDYFIENAYMQKEEAQYMALQIVTIENGELNADLNTQYALVDEEAKLAYLNNKNVNFRNLVELENGYFYGYYAGYHYLYDSSLNIIDEINERLSKGLFLAEHAIYNTSGTRLIEFESGSKVSENILYIDGEYYEYNDDSIMIIDVDNVSNGFYYQTQEVKTDGILSVYKITARKLGTNTSVTYYSYNEGTKLGSGSTINNYTFYSVSGAYTTQDCETAIGLYMFS